MTIEKVRSDITRILKLEYSDKIIEDGLTTYFCISASFSLNNV